jgi:hypothetical protein
MTYPFTLWLTKQPNSESPFLAFFYGGLYCFWNVIRRKDRVWLLSFLAGLLMGIAMLIRAAAIGMGGLMAGLLWFTLRDLPRRRRLYLIALLLLGNFATGRVVPICTGGGPNIQQGLTYQADLDGYRQVRQIPPDVKAMMHDIFDQLGETPSLGAVTSILISELQKRPLTVAKLFAIKVGRSWYGTDTMKFDTIILLIQIPYLVLILWSGLTAWKLKGKYRDITLSIFFIVIYFWMMTILVNSTLRYMMPVMGLLFILIPASFYKSQIPLKIPQALPIRGIKNALD